METTTLAPWLRVLAPVTRPWLVADASSLARRVRGLRVSPYSRLATGLHVHGQLQQIRCALELVALALRVDPRVWGLLHDEAGAAWLDLSEWDADTLGCEVEIECPAAQAGSAMCFELGAPQVEDYPPTALNEQYAASLRRLRALDTSQRLEGYRIPLTFNVVDAPSQPPVLLMLYEHAYGRSLDANGGVVTKATPFRPPAEGVSVRVGLDQIATVAAMGLPIGNVQTVASAATNSELRRTVELLDGTTQPPFAVSVHVKSDSDASSLFDSLSGGGRVETLSIDIEDGADVVLVARVLSATYPQYESLESVDVHCSKTLNVGDLGALDMALEQAKSSWSREATTPTRPIRSCSVSVVVETAECARRLLWLVFKCLPRGMSSLSLQIAVAGDQVARYSEVLTTVLRTFPQLAVLRLRMPFQLSVTDLVESYASGRCSIRSVSFHNSDSDMLPLVRALADPTARVAHVLDELSISVPHANDVLVEAIITMLRSNRKLQYLELVSAEPSSLRTRLRKIDRAMLLSRRKVAFLSVVVARGDVVSPTLLRELDGLVVARIFGFAESPRCCRVVVRGRD